MALVYKARDNILGRLVAIKVLREQYASDEQFVVALSARHRPPLILLTPTSSTYMTSGRTATSITS